MKSKSYEREDIGCILFSLVVALVYALLGITAFMSLLVFLVKLINK